MLETIIAGGSMMIPMMIESVLALGVIFDRIWAFYLNSKVDTRAFRAELLELVGDDRIADALALCRSTPCPVSAVLLVGLEAYEKQRGSKKSPEQVRFFVEQAMSAYSVRAIESVEKRLKLLSFVGGSAPLFGMTGTVTGMIKSFDAIAQAAAMDSSIVAAGIAEALITTAAGLLIALGAVIPYHMFLSMSRKIETEIEDAGQELLDCISVKAEG